MSGRGQWQHRGFWWEFGLRGSVRFWGKKLQKSEAAHGTGVGGFSDLLGRLAFVPMGLHNKMVTQAWAMLSGHWHSLRQVSES